MSTIRLSDSFFNVESVQKKNNYDSFTRGMLTQSVQKQDRFFTDEVSIIKRYGNHSINYNETLTLNLGQRILIQNIEGFGRIRLD